MRIRGREVKRRPQAGVLPLPMLRVIETTVAAAPLNTWQQDMQATQLAWDFSAATRLCFTGDI